MHPSDAPDLFCSLVRLPVPQHCSRAFDSVHSRSPGHAQHPDKLDIIQGRVTGARSGQQIVLYVRNGEMLDPAAAERAVHSKMKPSVCATMATEVAQRRSLIRDS